MSDVGALLDALDLVVSRAARVLGPDEIADPAAATKELRHRRGFLGETLVLAFAGGTGSGKSSLLNALAGDKIASTSRLRPHTDVPLAWIPQQADPGLAPLLDEFGIEERVPQDRYPHLAILDLPDHDSIVGSHRATVGSLLPQVDAVAWVVDPEKYRDRVLHEDYLAPLADYQEQFIFILNQIDRIGDDVDAVMLDLEAALAADGIRGRPIIPVAADPSLGSPLGIEDLELYLAEKMDAKRVSFGKLVSDVRRVAMVIGFRARLRSGAALGFEERWRAIRDATVVGIVEDDGGILDDTLCRIEDFVAAVAVETGGTFGAQFRDSFGTDMVEEAVAASIASVGRDEAGIAAELEARLGTVMRERLWERALLAGALALLEVEAARIEASFAPSPGPGSAGDEKVVGGD